MYRIPVRSRVTDAITSAARARIALLCGARHSGRSTALRQWTDLSCAQHPTTVCSDRGAVFDALRCAAEHEIDATIVVDDLDRVLSSEDLPEFLDALERAPHARVVGVVGWDGLWLAEGVAMTVEVATVDDRVLAFTESELREELEGQGTSPSVTLVADAVRTFAGWPPVVRAMSAVLQFEGFGDARSVEDETRFIGRVRQMITDGFARRLSPAALRALAPLSLAPQCSASGAARILGCDESDAATILAELEERGLGSWRSVNGRRRFRMSEVARGTVSSADTSADPDVHGRIALELARDGFARDAIRHALTSDEPEVFEQVLEATCADALRSDPHGLSSACQAGVRRGLVQSTGARALVVLVQWHVDGVVPAAPGDGGSGAVDPSRGDPLLDVAEAVRHLCAGNVAVARRLAFRADASNGPAAALTDLTRAEVLMHTAPGTHESSERKTVLGAFRQVVGRYPGAEASFAAMGYIALLQLLDGDVADARNEMSQIPTWLTLRWGAGPWGRGHRLAMACSTLESASASASASEAGTRPAVIADEIARDDWGSDRCLAAAVEATARLHAGDLRAALRTSQTALRASNGWRGPWTRNLLESTRLDVAGGRRDEPEGAVLFAVISDAAAARLAMARCSLRRGDVHEALASAIAVLRSAELTTRNRVEALLVVGASARRSGLVEEAQRAILEAADVSTRHRLTTPWYFAAPEASETADEVLDDDTRRLLNRGPRLCTETVIPVLTPRELVVLETRARSRSLREVAARLTVSQNTVKTQLHSAYRKLGVSSASQAIARAIDLGVIDGPEPIRRESVGLVGSHDRRLVG